jgi:hypothetical protein
VEQNWELVIFSDESHVVLRQNNRVYVWRSAQESYRPDCMYTISKPKVSVMIWGCISWYGPGTLCKVQSNINAQKYINILDNHLWSAIAQHFPANNYVFQDHNAPVHRAHVEQEYKHRNNIRGMV